jgi:hypothetical protein
LLDGLGWIESIVDRDEIDLPPIDSTLVIDLREIRRLGFAEGTVAGSRAAVGHRLPDFDFGVGDAGPICFLSGTDNRRRQQKSRCEKSDD